VGTIEVSTWDLEVGTNVESSVSVSHGAEVRRRRRWSVQEKLQIVLETLEAGVSVPVVARRHCVNANQLFIWRSQYHRGELGANDESARAVKLLPVQVEPAVVARQKVAASKESVAGRSGCMEIEICGGRHVKIWGQIDAKALRVLVRELLRPC
jgi:transposase